VNLDGEDVFFVPQLLNGERVVDDLVWRIFLSDHIVWTERKSQSTIELFMIEPRSI
jgi:hypothetical protein